MVALLALGKTTQTNGSSENRQNMVLLQQKNLGILLGHKG
jgi:hypothetical protein